jgi:hypothetical protein
MQAPDLTLLKPGARVKLRGDAKPQPAKPYPRGWKTVAEVDHISTMPWTTARIRVEEEQRWLPVSLIEEIVP